MASPGYPPSPSTHRSRPSSSLDHDESDVESIPVEVLVQYLLEAKRSLSSISQVLRANELITAARIAHEESVILDAQTQFLHRSIKEQISFLSRVHRSMIKTYESGKYEFDAIIKHLDSANARLQKSMDVLKGRLVEAVFRPMDEEPRNLLDFVEVGQVETLRDALKENIVALQATQTSFDGDILRLHDDLRDLKKSVNSALQPSSPLPPKSSARSTIPDFLASMMENSHAMAEHLNSLSRHFDLCATAVRTTEGGAALARRKAAEASQSQSGNENVSISGVIPEQDAHVDDIEHESPKDRSLMFRVLEQDAPQVGGVVQEINEQLHLIEENYSGLKEQTEQTRNFYLACLSAFRALEVIGSRVRSYAAAETEFRERWNEERAAIDQNLGEMEGLRSFCEQYAAAYDRLIVEVDRRKTEENRVANIWRKARENVEKVIDTDQRQRDAFRQDVADFIPKDLWLGIHQGMRKWEVMPIRASKEAEESVVSTPSLKKDVVQTATKRLYRTLND